MSKINEIVQKLTEASNAYYLTNIPIMSDADFDALRDELESLDPKHPFLSTVGVNSADSVLTKAKHRMPMGSLKKIRNSEEEFRTWLRSIENDAGTNPELVVTWKMDGASIELIYENSRFIQAITRGDGIVGEDVTHTIKNAKGFPKILHTNVSVSVRVEALFLLDDWKKGLCGDGQAPRNAASGTVRRSDGQYSERLHCIAYDIEGDAKWTSLEQKLQWLGDMGFKTPEILVARPNDVSNYVNSVNSRRDKLPYEIDGLVIAVNSCDVQKKLGEHKGYPYWARAWKLPAMGGFSKVLRVDWTVGSQGTINPVAVIEPVQVGGVTIQNVSLHNMDEIKRLGLKIGDTIEVVRAGDVIPMCTRVVKPGNSSKIIKCTECPACDCSTEQRGPFLYCTNPECPGVFSRRIAKYIAKREIMYFGESAQQKLLSAGLIDSILDLYRLTETDMINAGLGDGMAAKIRAEIEKSKDCTLADMVGSLSIDLLGRSEAQNIVDGGIDTLDKWRNLEEDDLLKLEGFKDIKAGRIIKSLKKNWDLIEKLAKLLNIKEKKMAVKSSKGKFAGKTFCFTGKALLTRDQLHGMVHARAGSTSDRVDGNVTHLVLADIDSTSNKAVKARKMGIKLITEDEFMRMCGE